MANNPLNNVFEPTDAASIQSKAAPGVTMVFERLLMIRKYSWGMLYGSARGFPEVTKLSLWKLSPASLPSTRGLKQGRSPASNHSLWACDQALVAQHHIELRTDAQCGDGRFG